MKTNGYYIKDVGIVIDFSKIFRIIMKEIWIIMLVGITTGLFTMICVKSFIDPTYIVESKVYIMNRVDSTYWTTYDISASSLFTQDYTELVYSLDFLEEVISHVGADMSAEELKANVQVVAEKVDSRIMKFTVSCHDPYDCYEIGNEIPRLLKEKIKRIIPSCQVEIAETAVYPYGPSKPQVKIYTVLGALMGAFLAFFIICVIRLTDNKISSEKDVIQYLDLTVLGMIPINK